MAEPERNPFSAVPPPRAMNSNPFQPDWAGDIQAGIRPEFDPQGSGYDYASALAHGIRRDPVAGGHLYSRDPKTGQELKGAAHPTFWMGLQGDKDAGYSTFVGPDQRYYSTPTPKGALQRLPQDHELEFFHANPDVGGYASPDGKIVMNPFSGLGPEERHGVMKNELYRLLARDSVIPRYTGKLSPEQEKSLDENRHYAKADPADRVDTIIGRLLSGDPSAPPATPDQTLYLNMIRPQFDQLVSQHAPMEVD